MEFKNLLIKTLFQVKSDPLENIVINNCCHLGRDDGFSLLLLIWGFIVRLLDYVTLHFLMCVGIAMGCRA